MACISKLSPLKSYSPPGLGKGCGRGTVGRGDFQGPAGKVTPDVRCSATPNRVLQGRQISWVLRQNTPRFNRVAPPSEGTHGWRSYQDLCCGRP